MTKATATWPGAPRHVDPQANAGPNWAIVSSAPRGYIEAEITSGASISADVDLGSGTLLGLVMPVAWTAAVITFQVSWDGTTWNNLFWEDGTEVTIQAGASRRIALDWSRYVGVRFVRVRSGTSGASVNQAGARSIGLVFTP